MPHDLLVLQAIALGYNLRLLRLSLAGYRLPRALMIDGVCSRTVVASRGITAGAGHAVVELRLLLSDLWDAVRAAHPSVCITVFVDDTGLEASGSARHVAQALPAATIMVAEGIEARRMCLSGTKCVVCGSTRAVAGSAAVLGR